MPFEPNLAFSFQSFSTPPLLKAAKAPKAKPHRQSFCWLSEGVKRFSEFLRDKLFSSKKADAERLGCGKVNVDFDGPDLNLGIVGSDVLNSRQIVSLVLLLDLFREFQFLHEPVQFFVIVAPVLFDPDESVV